MFLENLYGTLFYPSETFEKLKQNSNLIISLFIVIFISALNNFVKLDNINLLSSSGIVLSAIFGAIKWVFFAFFIEMIAAVFQKGGKIERFLTLSAYALLPWIFLGPISLFKTGGMFTNLLGVLAGFAVWVWTTILTLYAVVKAYDLSSERILILIFIPLLGGIIFFDWIIGFFSTLSGIISL